MRRYDKSLVWLADKLDSLTREHDQAVQDAERYRYVRAAVAANKTFPISPDEYDVMIDAARSPTPE